MPKTALLAESDSEGHTAPPASSRCLIAAKAANGLAESDFESGSNLGAGLGTTSAGAGFGQPPTMSDRITSTIRVSVGLELAHTRSVQTSGLCPLARQ